MMSQDLMRLDIQGMTCAACVSSVEIIVNKHESVKAVNVNLPLSCAAIQLHDNAPDSVTEEIIQKIKQGGLVHQDQNNPRIEERFLNNMSR